MSLRRRRRRKKLRPRRPREGAVWMKARRGSVDKRLSERPFSKGRKEVTSAFDPWMTATDLAGPRGVVHYALTK